MNTHRRLALKRGVRPTMEASSAAMALTTESILTSRWSAPICTGGRASRDEGPFPQQPKQTRSKPHTCFARSAALPRVPALLLAVPMYTVVSSLFARSGAELTASLEAYCPTRRASSSTLLFPACATDSPISTTWQCSGR